MLNRLTSLGIIIFSSSSYSLFSENNSNTKAEVSTAAPAENSISVNVKNPIPVAPDFHKQVRPILEASCIECHGIEKQKGDLRLDTLANLLKGGDSGPAIVPGKIDESILLERIFLPADDDEIMPPENGPLSLNQQDILRRWIITGANWPKGVQLFPVSKQEFALRKKAESKKLVSLQIHPKQISLSTKEDFNSFVVVAKYDDDVTRDVTKETIFSLSDEKIAQMQNHTISPVRDGKATLKASFRNLNTELSIQAAE